MSASNSSLGPAGDELPVDEVRRPRGGRVGGRGEVPLAPLNAPDPNAGHETGHGAPGDPVAFPAELLVDSPGSVDLVVGLPHPPDLVFGDLVAAVPGRWRPGLGGVVRPLAEPDRATHHRHRPVVPVAVDEPDVYRWRGSTS